jgi:hypothetical protein
MSVGRELIEAAQRAQNLLTHFFRLSQAVNNLEKLVGHSLSATTSHIEGERDTCNKGMNMMRW